MAKFRFDILALETFGRVFGVRALLEALDKALPEAEWQQREELLRLAKEQDWPYEEYEIERQVREEKSAIGCLGRGLLGGRLAARRCRGAVVRVRRPATSKAHADNRETKSKETRARPG